MLRGWLWQEADEAWIDGTLQTHQLFDQTDIFFVFQISNKVKIIIIIHHHYYHHHY